ncbi:MAG: hypothetical protein ABSG13_10280 [Bryobacteraceae bacterium]|jgi:hypothetical protein
MAYTEQNSHAGDEEARVTPNTFWRAVLIAVVSVALAAPTRAESLDTAEKQIVTGIVVVSAAVGVLVTVLILHYKNKKTAITGCVISGPNGLSLADEKDRRTYLVSGDPVGIKLGERMTLEGQRKHSDKTLSFEARSVTKDFGVCQP